MIVPNQPAVECSSCTVPTDRADGLCAFCADPPPALDDALANGTGQKVDPVDMSAGLAAAAVSVLAAALDNEELGILAAIDLHSAREYLHAAARILGAHTRQEAR